MIDSKKPVASAPRKPSIPTAYRPIILSSTTNYVALLQISPVSRHHSSSANRCTHKTCVNRIKNTPTRNFATADCSIGIGGGNYSSGIPESRSINACFSASSTCLFSWVASLIGEPEKPRRDTPAMTIIKLSHLPRYTAHGQGKGIYKRADTIHTDRAPSICK